MRIVVSINTSWNLVNFRQGLLRRFVQQGHEVVALSPTDAYVPKLQQMGCRHVPIDIDGGGSNPLRDLGLFMAYVRKLRQIKPDLYLGYTVKPNVYGSLACHLLGIAVINNIAGLGTLFVKRSLTTRLVCELYRLALSRSYRVFFQNDDDLRQFIEDGLVKANRALRVPGSGVDLDHFDFRPKQPGNTFRFLLVARMLREKGVFHYAEAARQLTRRYPQARFELLGFLDVNNPSAIRREQIQSWVDEGILSYLGVSDDVREPISQADCLVLPSYYREGVPRSLLEAAALGKPLITTDMPGCREVVDQGKNGYLCQPQDTGSLVVAMEHMLAASHDELADMAKYSRQLVEQRFNESLVVDAYLNAISGLGAPG